MRCEKAHEHLSAAQDAALASGEHAALAAHLAQCPACREHGTCLEQLRRAVRYEPVGQVPDVAAAVVVAAAAEQQRRRWRQRVAVAASFVAAVFAGAAFVGLDFGEPAQVRAAVPEQVLAAQTRVRSLQARAMIVERGWHAEVPERRYTGRLVYQAPESLALSLDDRTTYPDERWASNDVEVVTDGDSWWAQGPAACPPEALPGCADPGPRTQAVTGREPFRAATPVPLDLIVPVRSFALAAEPQRLEPRQVAGRDAIGLVTTAGQVAPLLDGLRQAGTLRQVHPADRVELWLDARALVPLEWTVHAEEGPERARWAARHGYNDEAGTPVLEVSFADVVLDGDVPAESFQTPEAATARDAGFVDRPLADIQVPQPRRLPEGMRLHRAGEVRATGGAPKVSVASWSDGRAWVKVRATRDWEGQTLFGQPGDVVREVRVASGGVAYVGEGGQAIALHAEDVDVLITGSLPADELLEVAETLQVRGRRAPASWPASGTVSVEAVGEHHDGALVPPSLDGFAPAAARVVDDTVVITGTGPGARGFVLTQEPGATLTPPLEADVRGVEVRGVAGRYSPGTGELEWVEGGQVVSLRSATLSMDELVVLAGRLEVAE